MCSRRCVSKTKPSDQSSAGIPWRGPPLASTPLAAESKPYLVWHLRPIEHLVNVDGSRQMPAIKPWIGWIWSERADDDNLRLMSYPVLLDSVKAKSARTSEQQQHAQCPERNVMAATGVVHLRSQSTPRPKETRTWRSTSRKPLILQIRRSCPSWWLPTWPVCRAGTTVVFRRLAADRRMQQSNWPQDPTRTIQPPSAQS